MQWKVTQLLAQNGMLENGLGFYIPRKFDKVDRALANYLNNYSDRHKMKIIFLRESEGVYTFGRRRVHIKVEKANQIYVRVGGGYIHVKEFIEKYTPIEMRELERKQEFISKSQQKLLVQHKLFNRSNSSAERPPKINQEQSSLKRNKS